MEWKDGCAGYGYYEEYRNGKFVAGWFPCDNSHLGTFKIEHEEVVDDDGNSTLYDFDGKNIFNDG